MSSHGLGSGLQKNGKFRFFAGNCSRTEGTCLARSGVSRRFRMFSKPVAVGVLLVLACITGAAGGAYFAGRQSTPEASAEAASVPPAPAPASAAQDTEAVITPSATTGSAPAPAVELPAAPASVALETERVKATPAAPVRPRRSEPAPAARSSSASLAAHTRGSIEHAGTSPGSDAGGGSRSGAARAARCGRSDPGRTAASRTAAPGTRARRTRSALDVGDRPAHRDPGVD